MLGSGCSLADLQAYTDKLNTFSRHHVIGINEGQERFKSSLISWHTKYKTLLVSYTILNAVQQFF